MTVGRHPSELVRWRKDAARTGTKGEQVGDSTRYLGRFDIEPPLNAGEVEWLRAYARTLRREGEDPYAVPMNPGAMEPPHGTGRVLTCEWAPCPEGCCLEWQPGERSDSPRAAVRYLIDHFLRPGAHASLDGRPDFDVFTFDHMVSGTVAAENDETRELYLVTARRNTVRQRTLVGGGEREMW